MKRIKERYAVNKVGEVFSLYSKRKMSLGTSKHGYPVVGLWDNKEYSVHRLVAQAYIPNPHNLPTVNHKNGIKDDNRVENLEWMSFEDNYAHAVENGFVNRRKSISKKRQVWLCELYKRGRTVGYLSELFCCGGSQVKNILEWYGVYEYNRVYSKIDKDLVRLYFESGVLSSTEISGLLDCTRVAVNKIRRELGMNNYTYYRDEAIKRFCKTSDDVLVCCMVFGISAWAIRKISGVEYKPTYEYAIQDLEKLKELVEKGWGRSEIKSFFSCGDKALDTALRRVGAKIQTRKYDYDKIKQLREQGLSYAKVADSIGATIGTIAQICQKNGWGGQRAESGYHSHRK